MGQGPISRCPFGVPLMDLFTIDDLNGDLLVWFKAKVSHLETKRNNFFEKLIGFLFNMKNCWMATLKIQNTITTSKIWMQIAKVGVQDLPPTRTFLLMFNNQYASSRFICNSILWNDVLHFWSLKSYWKYIINFLCVHVKYCVCKILK